MSRSQTAYAFSTRRNYGNDQSGTVPKESIWSSLLHSVSTGKHLPERNLVVLGGSSETQKDFLETLGTESTKRPPGRYRVRPSVANEFALGYTYQDVLDADQDDLLARLSIYTLLEPLRSFGPLLKPLLTSTSISETLLLILLDWAEPWSWLQQLRDWIRLVKEVLVSLDDDSKDAVESVMLEWAQSSRRAALQDSSENRNDGSSISIPLGPGEFDEKLGLPLCVVCHNAEMVNALETEKGWHEEEFDYILQFLRTILLKHGASLVYTTNTNPNSLPILLQSMLGIHSPLKRQRIRHNVIDRDKILIPANWDSWGKIRVLREGFDVEGISNGWSAAIALDFKTQHRTHDDNTEKSDESPDIYEVPPKEQNKVLLAYSELIQDPATHALQSAHPPLSQDLEVKIVANQDFLTTQLANMERLKAEEDRAHALDGNNKHLEGYSRNAAPGLHENIDATGGGRVNEHIGVVQFNMGGIQVDADDILKRLKEREREETPDRELSSSSRAEGASSGPFLGEKVDSVALTNFFQGLIKKGGGANSPRTKA